VSVRVVLCDDHAVLRAGLRALLQSEAGVSVVGEAADGHEAVERVLALRPDVAVMDITMPGQDGFAAARQIHRRAPEVKLLFLTMHEDREFLFQAMASGSRRTGRTSSASSACASGPSWSATPRPTVCSPLARAKKPRRRRTG
jgi:DNA-binding NarL/FixJ family response regulator